MIDMGKLVSMPTENPFADDPLPEHAVRLQSAADPFDPYAAPAGADEYKTDRDPGVGTWRDGKWLVMHREAEFPPRCIFTNLEAETYGKQSITWAYLYDLRGHAVKLRYGLTIASRNRMRRMLAIAIIVDIVIFALMSLLVGVRLNSDGPLAAFGPLFLVFVLLFGVTIKIAWNAFNPLNYVSSKKSYVWLSGAGSPFLNSLPTWPGFRG
jgi:hypothetical protein